MRSNVFILLLCYQCLVFAACFEARESPLSDVRSFDPSDVYVQGDGVPWCLKPGASTPLHGTGSNVTSIGADGGGQVGTDGLAIDDGSIGMDAGTFVFRCNVDSNPTDRKGELSISFQNLTRKDLYLVSSGSMGVLFFLDISFFYDRATCFCAPESCGRACDDGPPLGFTGTTTLAPCEKTLSKNWKPFFGGVGDGYRIVKCQYECRSGHGGEVSGPCQQGIPINSGTYQIAFCLADRASSLEHKLVYPSTTAASLVCPEGYKKIMKTISVGKEDSLIVVPIEASDLQ